MEERLVPGDGFWSLSLAPISALLDAAAALVGQSSELAATVAGPVVVEADADTAGHPARESAGAEFRDDSSLSSTYYSSDVDGSADRTGPAAGESDDADGVRGLDSPLADLFANVDAPSSAAPAPVGRSAGGTRGGWEVQAYGVWAASSVGYRGAAVDTAARPAGGVWGEFPAVESSFADDTADMLGVNVDAAAAGDADNSPQLTVIQPNAGPLAGPSGISPARIRHAYGLDKLALDGFGQTIAIVDAYHTPNILKDVNVFSKQFALPQFNVAGGPTLSIVNQTGGTKLPTATNKGWATEVALDVEWAHAIAPRANILLVEATNSFSSNMYPATAYAATKAHVVSLSWGSNESSSDPTRNGTFNKPGVVFTVSSGDYGTGVIYPAASPNVVAVGGTTLKLDAAGNRLSETAWSGSGGGISKYQSGPGYQTKAGVAVGGKRSVPDVSWDADPSTGFAVYDTSGSKGWLVVGGTSAGAPQWAGLVALVNQGRAQVDKTFMSSPSLTSSLFYNAASTPTLYSSNYFDITSGTNGTGPYTTAVTGYDAVTGYGSPKGDSLVKFLVATP